MLYSLSKPVCKMKQLNFHEETSVLLNNYYLRCVFKFIAYKNVLFLSYQYNVYHINFTLIYTNSLPQ